MFFLEDIGSRWIKTGRQRFPGGFHGAEGGTRTHTAVKDHKLLRLTRLPIPPLPHPGSTSWIFYYSLNLSGSKEAGLHFPHCGGHPPFGEGHLGYKVQGCVHISRRSTKTPGDSVGPPSGAQRRLPHIRRGWKAPSPAARTESIPVQPKPKGGGRILARRDGRRLGCHGFIYHETSRKQGFLQVQPVT